MNGRKWLCVLLAAVLLLQVIPVAVLAEDGGALTATERAAAIALAGSRSPDVGDHSENISLENMSALQLSDWSDDLLDQQIKTLETSCEDIEYALYSLQQKDPAKYQELTSGDAAGYPDQIHSLFRQTEDLKMKVENWKNALTADSSTILRNNELLEEPNTSDYDRRFFTYQMLGAKAEILIIRQEIQNDELDILAWLAGNLRMLGEDTGLGGWTKKVLMAESPKVSETTGAST